LLIKISSLCANQTAQQGVLPILGRCRVFSHFHGLRLVPAKWRYLVPPQAANARRWARIESEYRVKIYETKDFQWARRLSKNDIYRLYQSEASGLLDEELLEEIGTGFYSRCETIKQVTERLCPSCSEVIQGAFDGNNSDRQIACQHCQWISSWKYYHGSYKNDRIHGGRAYKYFLAYLGEYPLCKTARDKMLAIDRLIHYLHEDIDDDGSVTPAAMNLVQGKRHEIREFIESLAYSGNMPEQNRRLRNELFRKMEKRTDVESESPK
jgi:hypothetical protein